jgi:pyrroloquinoline-quinone synthase
MTDSASSQGPAAWSTEEFTRQLRRIGQNQYHDKHPFHCLMNEGQLTREQVQVWAANRFYYQKNIPIKDAVLLSRCEDRTVRQRWIQRIIDHDGTADHSNGAGNSNDAENSQESGNGPAGIEPGGIEKWLRLGEAVGLSRGQLEDDTLLLPGVRFAVDAYVAFVRTHDWIEGVASSLTELFAPALMARRLDAFIEHYRWVDAQGLAYFKARLTQAPRDSDHALSLVLERCRTRELQQRAVAALQFKCDLLWAQLDAIYLHCVSPETQAKT